MASCNSLTKFDYNSIFMIKVEKMKRKIILLIALIPAILIICLSVSGEVSVKEIEMNIPTYVTGPDDPSPPLWNLKVYPYPMQTDITRKKISKKYRVVVMENDYIKLLILPDVGGRILAAFDKTNNNFDFIYHNQVIKPGLVALRGAWLSGGIEWNFPTLGHTVNTFSPVNYKILNNADGSITCVVGTEEWVRRMKWEVFISIFPGRSYFKTRIRLYNRTLTHNNGYFWANAATHARKETRVVFPPAEYTYAGGRRNPRPWPVYQGKDVSWYKNTPYAHDYFLGIPGDYSGAYNYEEDNGTAHYASRFESPGKKFWTWGTAPSGTIWEDLLTDEDGQYIEVQAGRLLTQGDTWIFEPHLVEEWDEWWYPVKNMNGFVKVNPDAALNLELRDEGVFIALNTTRVFENAEVKLFRGERQVFSERLDISPEGFYKNEISSGESRGIYSLEFLDRYGQKIIDHTTEKTEVSPPELQPDFSMQESDSAEIIFLKGYYSMKHWDEEGAMYYFKKALDVDPEFSAALKWLGVLYYKTGKTKEALEMFERVLERNEDDHTARYYRALSKIRLGIRQRVEEDLYMVSRRAGYRHVAPYLLAALELEKKNYRKAAEFLKKAIKNNPADLKARVMLAASERHLNHEVEAEALIESVLKEDPISPLALLEKELLSGESELDILRVDPEYYLEASADYSDMNLTDDAIRILEIYGENTDARDYPILYYYLGFFNDKLGQREEAAAYFKKAATCSPDYVFPFRVETEEVLKLALEYDPSDWKAHYYLGNLLVAKLRWEEGLDNFKKAAEFTPGFPMLYRNLGEVYWKKLKDYEEARDLYEKAVSLAPDDYRLYVALDELYALTRKHSSRARLYREAPRKVRGNFNYVLKRAQYYVDIGEYARALRILKTDNFLPWEGWTGAREVFVLAHLGRAYSYMTSGKYKKAINDFFEAMQYPENLGTGRPLHPLFTREYFFIGLCYEKQGNRQRAEKYINKVKHETTGIPSAHSYYKALSLRKLGENDEAEKLLQEMKQKSESLIELSRRKKPQYYLWASMACDALGEKIRAREYLRKANEIDPSFRWVGLFASEIKLLE
jgi:tetratricopeptide (TPR) repeat protein